METAEPPRATGTTTGGEASRDVSSHITMGPEENWVVRRPVDERYRTEAIAAQLILLLDNQHNAHRQATHRRVVQRLQTMRGVQDASQWRLNFDPATQHVLIHSITTWRGGEGREHADLKRFRFLQREARMESLVIDGSWTVVLLLEDVRVGDILDVSYTVTTRPRFMGDRFSALIEIPRWAPIRAFHASVRFPKRDPIHWTGLDAIFGASADVGDGEMEWNWAGEHLEPEEAEANVPSWLLKSRWIHLSNYRSWNQVAAAFAAAWPGRREHPEVAAYAQELLAEEATVADAARRAIEFVQDEVRYLSVDEDFGGQIPAAPETVLRRRYGDCKDKSALLAEMLKAMGIPARPVLVNNHLRGVVKSFLPSPNVFNRAVVEYVMDGERRWVDATESMQGGHALERAGVPCEAGLPVDAAAEGLEEIGATGVELASHTVDETWHLDTVEQTATLCVTCATTGEDADSVRRFLALEGAAELARRREQTYRGMYPSISRVQAMELLDDRVRNRLVIAEVYRVERPFSRTGNVKLYGFTYASHLMQWVLGLPATKGTRKAPLALRAGKFEHRIELNAVSMESRDVRPARKNAVAFDYYMEARRSPGRWQWNYTLDVKTDVLSPEFFAEHKEAVDQIWPSTLMKMTVAAGVRASVRRAPAPAELLSGRVWKLGERPAVENRLVIDGQEIEPIRIRPRGMPEPAGVPMEAVRGEPVEVIAEQSPPAAPADDMAMKPKRSSRRAEWQRKKIFEEIKIWVAIALGTAGFVAVIAGLLRHMH